MNPPTGYKLKLRPAVSQETKPPQACPTTHFPRNADLSVAASDRYNHRCRSSDIRLRQCRGHDAIMTQLPLGRQTLVWGAAGNRGPPQVPPQHRQRATNNHFL